MPTDMSRTFQQRNSLLFTCRYWALGPKCPNVDAHGTNTCEFAHYVTGKLASHVQQRGTCIIWGRGVTCRKGAACWYEHRRTGVSGLYQGTIDLTGFELQVADAARKAGFNTRNHEALFNLIWSVKRLALRTSSSSHRTVPPPPQHPIYPDRYRPSGIGDNTDKKRPPHERPAEREIELKFHPIKPLMRKRPLDDAKAEKEHNVIDLTGDSDSEDLIVLDTPPADTNKRQKVDKNVKREIKSRNDLVPLTNTSSVNTSNASPSEWQRKRGGRRSRAARQEKTAMASSNVPIRHTSPAAMLPRKPLTADEEIASELLVVRDKLEEARKNMNTCQATMKALFDNHYHKFDGDRMIEALQQMSKNMNQVYDASKDGAADVDKAMVLLKMPHHERLRGMLG